MSELKPQAESLESLLSTAIGLLMSHKERIGYKPNSVIAKFVDECVERLKDWPYTTAAQPAQAGQVLTDRHTLQAQGKHPAPCARFCEANAFRIEERQQARLIAELEAKVKALTLETERTARNRDMWKGQTQRQADRLHALHSCMAALRRLLARDPCAHAGTAIQMIDAAIALQPNSQAEGEPPCSPT